MPTYDVQEQTSPSQMNAETLTRATTLLFGEHESCTARAHLNTHSICTSAFIHLPNGNPACT